MAVCRKRVEERPVCQLSRLSVYGDYRELIADPLVQAVVVVTSPSLCHDICLASVQAGKPILIEKPLAMTGQEARAMVAAADAAGVLIMTAQTMRFDSTILSVKQHLPTLGRLQRGRLTSHIESQPGLAAHTWTGPLGAVLEIGVHLLDLVRFVTGEEVVEVECTMERSSIGAPETAAQVFLTTTGAIRCDLDIARVELRRVGTMEWVGTEGTMTADWTQRRITRQIGRESLTEWTVEPRPTIVVALEAFVHAVNTHTPPPVTGLDGCRAVELVDACHQSAELAGAAVRPASLD